MLGKQLLHGTLLWIGLFCHIALIAGKLWQHCEPVTWQNPVPGAAELGQAFTCMLHKLGHADGFKHTAHA